jgi:hypothetical protein
MYAGYLTNRDFTVVYDVAVDNANGFFFRLAHDKKFAGDVAKRLAAGDALASIIAKTFRPHAVGTTEEFSQKTFKQQSTVVKRKGRPYSEATTPTDLGQSKKHEESGGEIVWDKAGNAMSVAGDDSPKSAELRRVADGVNNLPPKQHEAVIEKAFPAPPVSSDDAALLAACPRFRKERKQRKTPEERRAGNRGRANLKEARKKIRKP